MTDPDLDLKPRLERLGDRVQPRSDAFDRLDRVRALRARGRRLGTIALAFVVAVAGTWGAFAAFRSSGAQPAGDPTPVIDSPCATPLSASLDVLVGKNPVGFNVDCWNAPADTALTIEFDNRFSQAPAVITIEPLPCPSDIAALPSPAATVCDPTRPKPFTSDVVEGERTTLHVPALEPGIYLLFDRLHLFTTQIYVYVGPGPFPDPVTLASPSPSGAPPGSCDGISAPHAQIRFQDLAWDLTCWNAPAGQSLVIHYLNRSDGIPSGLAIVPIDTCQASVVFGDATNCAHQDPLAFDGSVESGPGESIYEIGTLPPGTYVMYDPVHPVSAHATLIVD